MAQIQKSTDSSSLAEVIDRVLDKGIVIDAFVKVSLVGIELISIEARIVIASVETYLKYAEAIGLTAFCGRSGLNSASDGLDFEVRGGSPPRSYSGRVTLEDDMQFGKSLARLANDIAAGYGARNEIAVARATSLAALNAETQQTLSDNNAQRAAVARDLAATAADLRQRLAAGDAALEATVQNTLTAARQDLAAKRQTISDNARALRSNLDASRRKASDALTAFRTEVRADQAATAAALSESLGKFAS